MIHLAKPALVNGMAKRKRFWNEDRLKELARLAKTMAPYQLEKHFGKRREEITQALEFIHMHKRLKITTKKIRTKHLITRITFYRAAHAEGSHEGRHFRHDDYVL